MSINGYAYRTVSSHISAISYINKLNNFKDETQFLIAQKLIQDMQRNQSRKDTERPIASVLYAKSLYEQTLISVAFQLAFNALLRVSETYFPYKGVRLTENKFILFLPHSKTD